MIGHRQSTTCCRNVRNGAVVDRVLVVDLAGPSRKAATASVAPCESSNSPRRTATSRGPAKPSFTRPRSTLRTTSSTSEPMRIVSPIFRESTSIMSSCTEWGNAIAAGAANGMPYAKFPVFFRWQSFLKCKGFPHSPSPEFETVVGPLVEGQSLQLIARQVAIHCIAGRSVMIGPARRMIGLTASRLSLGQRRLGWYQVWSQDCRSGCCATRECVSGFPECRTDHQFIRQ